MSEEEMDDESEGKIGESKDSENGQSTWCKSVTEPQDFSHSNDLLHHRDDEKRSYGESYKFDHKRDEK